MWKRGSTCRSSWRRRVSHGKTFRTWSRSALVFFLFFNIDKFKDADKYYYFQVGDYKQRIRNPAYTAELFPPPCPSGELRCGSRLVVKLKFTTDATSIKIEKLQAGPLDGRLAGVLRRAQLSGYLPAHEEGVAELRSAGISIWWVNCTFQIRSKTSNFLFKLIKISTSHLKPLENVQKWSWKGKSTQELKKPLF